jgi:membrane protease YdiL (CAAX protease family)
MSAVRIMVLALLTQGGLIALSWWAGRALHLPLTWGTPLRDAGIGAAVALALATANYLLLTRAPANWLVTGVRATYRETIVPLFGGLPPFASIVLGVAAGFGEEWLFRGILQPLTGLAISSVVFGLAHVGTTRMVPFGVWAAAMGVVMGTLLILTGGLTAPMVAHGLYDILALEYIRRGANEK